MKSNKEFICPFCGKAITKMDENAYIDIGLVEFFLKLVFICFCIIVACAIIIPGGLICLNVGTAVSKSVSAAILSFIF